MKKAAFYTLGCKVNQYETEAMTESFENAGYEIVDYSEFADVYITVSYTHLRAHETVLDLVCRLLLEKKKKYKQLSYTKHKKEL